MILDVRIYDWLQVLSSNLLYILYQVYHVYENAVKIAVYMFKWFWLFEYLNGYLSLW